jgi:hypothetical protein
MSVYTNRLGVQTSRTLIYCVDVYYLFDRLKTTR